MMKRRKHAYRISSIFALGIFVCCLTWMPGNALAGVKGLKNLPMSAIPMRKFTPTMVQPKNDVTIRTILPTVHYTIAMNTSVRLGKAKEWRMYFWITPKNHPEKSKLYTIAHLEDTSAPQCYVGTKTITLGLGDYTLAAIACYYYHGAHPNNPVSNAYAITQLHVRRTRMLRQRKK